MGADQNVSMTLSLVMKTGFTITIRRRSVKVKFGLQEIIHSKPKFVDNVQRSIGKHMFAIFFLKFGFNTVISLENGKTVASKWYTEECLSNGLKQVEKHRRLHDLIMHHDNASSHKTTQTMEYLEGQRIKLMDHPAYSPDLSSCDLWLFPKIKEQLRGKNFQDINELPAAVQEQMKGPQKEDFYQRFEHWFERMSKCISVQGHYFEQT